MLTGILESDSELALHVLMHAPRHANSAGCRQRLEARRHVHAVAPHVAAVDDDVADIDAHAELDPLVGGDPDIALCHGALQLHGALHGVDDARKFGENAVTGDPHDPHVVAPNGGLDQCVPMGLQARERAQLVGANEPAIAGDVASQNGCQPTLLHPVRRDVERLARPARRVVFPPRQSEWRRVRREPELAERLGHASASSPRRDVVHADVARP